MPKCPKCQYISFDSGDRCRNCGYDFSLALDLPAPELPIKNESDPFGPMGDFSLNDTPNLPLFVKDTGDADAPLVTPSAIPRAPLAVRRSTPTPRPRRDAPHPRQDRVEEPRLALDTSDISLPAAPPAAAAAAPQAPAMPWIAASAGARLAGAFVDVLIVVLVDVTVVYFTLKICDLTALQLAALPLAPLIAFLALLNGGYVATFVAAGGQTIGKMAARTRVVPADPAAPVGERVTFGQAVLRAGGYLVSALPVGLGFVPAFFGQERRALHDRLADTRVVKA